MRYNHFIACFWSMLLVAPQWAAGAEVHQLNSDNWDALVPAGKEVDCIYGDHILRSDCITVVIGQAVDSRNANMTVKNVGGAVIDLTRRDAESDQLSCYYPLGEDYRLSGPVVWPEQLAKTHGAARLAFIATSLGPSQQQDRDVRITIAYELVDGEDFVLVRTLLTNETDHAITFPLTDAIRADGEFMFGYDPELNLCWCHDEFWRGAYGLTCSNGVLKPRDMEERRPLRIDYIVDETESGIEVPANGSMTLERRLIPAADTLGVCAVARELRGEVLATVQISVTDSAGPVPNVCLEVKQGERVIGKALADSNGQLNRRLPVGECQWIVSAQGHKILKTQTTVHEGNNTIGIQFGPPGPGYVDGQIADEAGDGVPCKIEFQGHGVDDPNFGPDSAVHGVRNLWYTSDGRFRVELMPGEYQLIVSHGPEYDAVSTTINVQPGETTHIKEQLRRTVNTTGWISADLHSHSSPSGDNTASQRGRVLNLLAEHLEFIPCTEHQRVSTYRPHLLHFRALDRVLTCPGMELTGSLLPINHQNAFPLIHRPRTQDGGGPTIDVNPVKQIARLAMWDDGSDKVVQINHPNIAQMVGDADLDGKPDEGFRQMFYYADVMEVHPPELIFNTQNVDERGRKDRGVAIRHWMQLLNLGYRVPGVVNTDAHWNFHGSGGLRNFVRSSTDDPAKADLMETCHALEGGQVVITNGPFMEVTATSGDKRVGPGRT